MPQLNPTPWFFILTLTWLSMLLIHTTKTLHMNSQNQLPPTLQNQDNKNPWLWPWY